MDRITNINNIVEILRNKIKPGQSRTNNTSSEKNDHNDNSLLSNESANLESVIINRINKLNTDDDDYQTKIKRIFIESVLIKEFGQHIADDQDFTDIVVDINRQISDNSILNKKLGKLLEQLTLSN